VIKPGNPPYLHYVRSSVTEKRQTFEETTGLGVGQFSSWVQSQRKGRKLDEKLDSEVHGNPNLVYESKMVDGWEPSGVPVGYITLDQSLCVCRSYNNVGPC
jgi:catechol O-methyltransferase